MIADNLYCRTSLEKTKPQASSIFLTDSTGKEKQSPAPFFDEWIFPSSLSRQRRKKPRNVFFAPDSPPSRFSSFSLLLLSFPMLYPFHERERERERAMVPSSSFLFLQLVRAFQRGRTLLERARVFFPGFLFLLHFHGRRDESE